MTANPIPIAHATSNVYTLTVAGEAASARVGPRSISFGRGEDVVSWDRAGRPYAGTLGGVAWRRALDGRLAEILTEDGVKRVRFLDTEETWQRAEAIRGWAASVSDAARGKLGDVVEAFAPAIAFDRAAWEHDAAAFAAVYQPVSILPPDQYLALVLQATLGCSWNRCTFCDFYRDRRYTVRTADELRAHALAVRRFFGAGAATWRSIFLADANAVATPAARVLEWLGVVGEMFPLVTAGGLTRAPEPGDPPRGYAGVHSFLDVFGGVQHFAGDWRLLRQAGLTRVYLGVETGHDPLLAMLGKPGSGEDAIELVHALKTAGVAVGVILLAGVGGQELAAEHVRASAALLRSLPLDRHDIVYTAVYTDRSTTAYRQAEREVGLTPLDEPAARAQAVQMRAAMSDNPRPEAPRAAIYDVGLFLY